MGAHKDRLIQAAELLNMSPDDLMTLLESTYRYPFADGLLGIARERQARILSATRVDPEDARTLARAFRELDIHLSAGGTPPEEWREGPDAPATDDEPDREPTPAQEEAWDAREDEARGHVLG